MSSTDLLSLVLSERPDLKGKMVYSPEQGNNAWTLIIGDEVFKAPRHEKQLQEFEREAKTLQEAAARGLPVPEVTYVGKNSYFFGMKKMPGILLVPEYLSEAEQDNLAIDLAVFKAQLEKAFPQKKPEKLENMQGRDAFGLFDSDRVAAMMKSPGIMEKTSACRLFYETMETYLKKSQDRHVMIHGDLRSENILIDRDTKRLAGIIDFGAAHYCLPEADIFGMSLCQGERLIEKFSQEYAARSESAFKLTDRVCYETAIVIDYHAKASQGASDFDRARAEAEIVKFILQTEKSLQWHKTRQEHATPSSDAKGRMRLGL